MRVNPMLKMEMKYLAWNKQIKTLQLKRNSKSNQIHKAKASKLMKTPEFKKVMTIMIKRSLREDTMTVIVEAIIIEIVRMADAITIMIGVIGAIIEIKTKIMRKKSLRIILIQILGSIT